MTKLRTGPWYEMLAALPTPESLKVVKNGTFTDSPGRKERRKAERAERNKEGKRRQRYHDQVNEYAKDNIKGTMARKYAVVGAMAKVSREAYAKAAE